MEVYCDPYHMDNKGTRVSIALAAAVTVVVASSPGDPITAPASRLGDGGGVVSGRLSGAEVLSTVSAVCSAVSLIWVVC